MPTRKLANLIIVALFLAACAPSPTPTPRALSTPIIPVVLTAAQVQERISRGGAIILDVRELSEWTDEGHIEGARFIPLEELDERAARELNLEDEIVVLCQNGNRSKGGAGPPQ
ncbi:MAG: rhodanese-like domain-containing protein [Anaerolineae bacterium]|nr:rhodanese-like domain-containing protein [Anaerolineae bacterium]